MFALAVFLVFLILAAQYQSWGLPFSVLLGTPFAAFGAYFGLWLARQFSPSYVNNVFAQIGLIMLIGLAAKNAILIVEFAKVEHEKGKPLVEAALLAAKLRLRPILMTAFAFILGVVPLLTASGRRRRRPQGDGRGRVLRACSIATILGVLLIPMLYVLVERVTGRAKQASTSPAAPRRRRRTSRRVGDTDVMPHPSRPRASSPRWRRSVALAGCTVGPNYERPQVPAPAQYRFVEAPAQAESMADLPWWQVFDDPALQALIREAIANNLDLRVAAARVEEARARAGIAKSFLYPQVDGAVGYNVRQASTTPATTRTRRQQRRSERPYGFRLSWEIDCSAAPAPERDPRRRSCSRPSRAGAACMVTLVGDVATNYFLLRELDVQLQHRARDAAARTTRR